MLFRRVWKTSDDYLVRKKSMDEPIERGSLQGKQTLPVAMTRYRQSCAVWTSEWGFLFGSHHLRYGLKEIALFLKSCNDLSCLKYNETALTSDGS